MDKSIGAVVFRHESNQIKYLLVKSARADFWGIPKGHPELSETAEQTAHREVLEETGYHIQLITGFLATINYILPQGELKQVDFYLAKLDSLAKNTIYDSAEIAESGWYDFSTAIKLLTYENSRGILTKAQNFITENGL